MNGFKVTNTNFGELLLKSVEQAREHSRQKITLSTDQLSLPDAPPRYTKSRIKRIRKELNVSQSVFAKLLNVSVQTVRAWEQGDNTPKGTTTRLLQIVESNPDQFLETLLSNKSA